MRVATAWCVILCMVALVAAFPGGTLVCRGDTNGDLLLNVLDLQVLLPAVLGQASGLCRTADTNGDGAVNILDLQYAVAHVCDTDTQDLPVRENTTAQDVILAQLVRCDWVLASAPAPETDSSAESQSAPMRHQIQSLAIPTSCEERYLYLLTPHAPPFVA